MANNTADNNTLYNNLFSSLVSDIKSYTGNDPLLPWLRGVRKMKEALPPQLLKEKLPRFLQKCAETFQTDRRYSNDLRYLRVWLQLMDFVDDPKAVLRTMEMNCIGLKKSLFYQAYALYYEKLKKFDAAEKIYHLGVQNCAEPADELQKSYEQFLCRLERHNKKRIQRQGRRTTNLPPIAGSTQTQPLVVDVSNKMPLPQGSEKQISMSEANHMRAAANGHVDVLGHQLCEKAVLGDFGRKQSAKEIKMGSEHNRKLCSNDTVVVKFVDTAIFGKSNVEDARHHGLVEPTINTKEAMNAINGMFREPLEPPVPSRRSHRNQPETSKRTQSELKIFTAEEICTGTGSSHQNLTEKSIMRATGRTETRQPGEELFQIYIDDEEGNDKLDKANTGNIQVQKSTGDVSTSSAHVKGFVFTSPDDLPSHCSKSVDAKRAPQAGLREDTVVYRFVGSMISDEQKVENVWHHGLVDPTINLKEAMNDINSMFGKPIEFTRKSRSKKQERAPDGKSNYGGFLILPDDELDDQQAMDDIDKMFGNSMEFSGKSRSKMQQRAPDMKNNSGSGFLILPDDEEENQQGKPLSSSSVKHGNDLFERTLCTKEAMDEINKMFAMPLDF